MSDRPSLRSPELSPVWERIQTRLEQTGQDNRGRVRVPDLAPPARLTLGALLGRPVQATISLAALEQALRALDIGPDLPAALAKLGYPVSSEPARRRAERSAGRAARAAARHEAAAWPEIWSQRWIDDVIRAGCLKNMAQLEAVEMVRAVRKLLDHLRHADTPERRASDKHQLARTDLAARLFGSAHALDSGTRLEAAAVRALAYWTSGHVPSDETDGEEVLTGREAWERAGIHLDLTSAPALTWNLPVIAGPGDLIREATSLGVPMHLSQFLLRNHPPRVPKDSDVLVVENPRLVEAAAQIRVPYGVVATNGNPSGAVQLLLDQLLTAGAALRYHGDFDAAGLAMCARIHDLGVAPWRMDTADYLAALGHATSEGVTLPYDSHPAPPTPWSPDLQATFDEHRLVIHEERLLPGLFRPMRVDGGPSPSIPEARTLDC